MNKTALKVLTTAVLSILMMSMLAGFHFASAQPSTSDSVQVVNPGVGPFTDAGGHTHTGNTGPDTADIGTSNFIFTTADTAAGDNFIVNITVGPNVSNLFGWGIGLIYDNSTLQFVSAWLPIDHVFAGAVAAGASLIAPSVVIAPVDSTHQEIQWGASYTQPTPAWSFNGTGTLAQVEFQIIQGPTILNSNITASFSFDPAWTSYYFWPTGSESPVNIMGTGYFQFTYVVPTTIPYFYVTPSTIAPLSVGQFFNVSVNIGTLSPAWSAIGFQFSLVFNQSIIAPIAAAPGTWINGFLTNGETAISTANDDYLYPLDLTLPGPGYNEWVAFQAIVPGTGGLWYAPFPSGGGTLYTFEFEAIVGTTSVPQITTSLTLTNMEVYNAFDQPVAVGTPINATYTAPLIVTGRSIDLFDQYPVPYGGQGPDNPSDTFAPQALVYLYANVTYNGFPVSEKPVAFEIIPPATATALTAPIYLSSFSDSNGIAIQTYRIPWPDVNPQQVLGIWTVTATVDIAQGEVTDTMQFEVQYQVSILSIVSNDTYVQSKYIGAEPAMKFTVTYQTYQMQSTSPPLAYGGEGPNNSEVYNVTVYYNTTVLETVSAFDNLGYFIGSNNMYKPIPVTSTWNIPNNWTDVFVIPLTTYAVVGLGTAYADAFSNYPINGGVPYCPEAETTFEIIAPP